MTLGKKGKKRSINKTSRRREEKASRDISGSRVSGSGSGIAKGDARNELWMVEDKFTVKAKRFSVTQDMIDKALRQAHKTGRNPVIRVGLPKYEVAVVLWDDFTELIDERNLDDL
jgi:hypothetical protein